MPKKVKNQKPQVRHDLFLRYRISYSNSKVVKENSRGFTFTVLSPLYFVIREWSLLPGGGGGQISARVPEKNFNPPPLGERCTYV